MEEVRGRAEPTSVWREIRVSGIELFGRHWRNERLIGKPRWATRSAGKSEVGIWFCCCCSRCCCWDRLGWESGRLMEILEPLLCEIWRKLQLFISVSMLPLSGRIITAKPLSWLLAIWFIEAFEAQLRAFSQKRKLSTLKSQLGSPGFDSFWTS